MKPTEITRVWLCLRQRRSADPLCSRALVSGRPHRADLRGVVLGTGWASTIGRRFQPLHREEAAMTATADLDPILATEATETIDGLLRLVALVRTEKHRDPLGALTDRLLELRTAVSDPA